LLVTVTCGGANVGYKEMGSVGMQTAPARMISRAQTVANTGRWIKKSTTRTLPFIAPPQTALTIRGLIDISTSDFPWEKST
jgi:hypothetical protein